MTAPTIGLLESAAALENLAKALDSRMHRQDDLTGLSSRREVLSGLATRLGVLARTYQLLRDFVDPTGTSVSGALQGSLAQAARAALPLLDAARGLSGRIAQEPRALLAQRVLDGLVAERGPRRVDRIQSLESAVEAAWRAFIGPTEAMGLEQILGKYPAFKSVDEALNLIREKLSGLARSLPQSAADLNRVVQLRNDRTAELEKLKNSGMDKDIVDFLMRSLEGVRLGEVLADDKILTWIKEHELMNAFLVRATTTGG